MKNTQPSSDTIIQNYFNFNDKESMPVNRAQLPPNGLIQWQLKLVAYTQFTNTQIQYCYANKIFNYLDSLCWGKAVSPTPRLAPFSRARSPHITLASAGQMAQYTKENKSNPKQLNRKTQTKITQIHTKHRLPAHPLTRGLMQKREIEIERERERGSEGRLTFPKLGPEQSDLSNNSLILSPHPPSQVVADTWCMLGWGTKQSYN
jgi:hypothetical protein